jgi:hypothetical protein
VLGYLPHLIAQSIPAIKHRDFRDSISRSLLQDGISAHSLGGFPFATYNFEAKMLHLLEDALPLTAGGDVEPTTELEVGGCYAPSIPQVSVCPGPTPGPKPKRPNLADGFDPLFRRKGWDIPASTDPTQEAGTSTSAETGSTGDTDAPVTKPSEIPPHVGGGTTAPGTAEGHSYRDLHLDQAECLGADPPVGD